MIGGSLKICCRDGWFCIRCHFSIKTCLGLLRTFVGVLGEKIRMRAILKENRANYISFRNRISCVNNCEDLLYIYFFIPQFKYMNFMYS